MDLKYSWRGYLEDDELVELPRAHGGGLSQAGGEKIRPHSLGWITARDERGCLVAFANVAWDGGDHAFLLGPALLQHVAQVTS